MDKNDYYKKSVNIYDCEKEVINFLKCLESDKPKSIKDIECNIRLREFAKCYNSEYYRQINKKN